MDFNKVSWILHGRAWWYTAWISVDPWVVLLDCLNSKVLPNRSI